jgi:outer membrane protein
VSFEIEGIEATIASTAQKIEQRLRASSHSTNASYANIAWADQAANAGRQNLSLVTNAYAEGTVSIVDLLDAQNASVQADENAANAVYDFLVEAIALQRATGTYEVLMTSAERKERSSAIRGFVDARTAEEGRR